MSYASNYPLKTVEQIAEIKGGKRLPAGHQFASASTEFGYIRAQDIGGGLIADPAVFIEPGTYESLRRYRVQSGDVCVTIAGNIGDIGFVKESMEGLTLTENAVRLTELNSVDARFLAYALQIPEVQTEMRASAAGAAQPKLGIYKVKAVAIPVPEDLATQRRIVCMLASYDDLIATNQRRIALLEDAARRLYREWFVHLRFPGHESVPVKDGVPEGWRISTFGEQVSIRKGKNLTRSSVIPGEIPVVAAGLEPMCYHNAANAKGPVITISASGANAGYVRLYHEDIWASDCSYISNDVTDDLYFFYCALKERQTEILLMQKGAAQPHVYPKDIQAMDMIWPCHEVVALFQEHVASMFAFCGALLMQSDQLAQARDLLLPKLMSGQLDVSGIRLPEEIAA